MKNRAIVILVCTLVTVNVILAIGCGDPRRAEPLTGPMPVEELQLETGKRVFLTRCHQCHPGGESGLGPALNNKPVPDKLLRFQVRTGLGVMPAFSEEEISDREMQDLLAYLRALRRHPDESEN